jgi:hypothetical protein
MTIPSERGPLTITGFGDFVRVLGSGYFFLPSKSALEVLRTLRGDLPLQLLAAEADESAGSGPGRASGVRSAAQ